MISGLRRTAGQAYRTVRPRPEVAAWRHACRLAAKTARYTPGEITLGTFTIEFTDLLTLCPQWEDLFVRRVLQFAAPTDRPVVLDCGANVGLASLFVKSCYPRARVTAFEADPAIAAVCRRNLARNGAPDVEVIEAAAWTHDGRVGFHIEGADSGAIVHAVSSAIDVPAVRLREWITRTPVDLLKLDIEGAEAAVLEDCADVLGHVRAIVLDLHEFDPALRQGDRVFEVLRHAGFTWTCSDLIPLPDRSSAALDSPFPGRATAWAQTVYAWPSSEKRA